MGVGKLGSCVRLSDRPSTTARMGKLVRDRIPEIIEASGRYPRTRTLGGADYADALHAKLVEEAAELRDAAQDGVLEEAADVLEVLRAIAEHAGHSLADVLAEAERKRAQRGGFSGRIWLESISPESISPDSISPVRQVDAGARP
jgi:predicted house-cleaning noncanonical NTP pyrophosphatase (MazG superfamily)